MVKRWCKRPPALVAIPRPGNPHLEQGQAGTKLRLTAQREAARFPGVPGRLLEQAGNGLPREMIIAPFGVQNAAYRLA